MQRILCLLALALTLAAEETAGAYTTDAGHAGSLFPGCDGLPTNDVPQFAVCYFSATIHVEAGTDFTGDYVCEGAQASNGNGIWVTNYSSVSYNGEPAEVTQGDGGPNDMPYNLALHFNCGCQGYSGWGDCVGSYMLAIWVNDYLHTGTNLAGTSITEKHDGSSFGVTINWTNVDDPSVTWHYTISKSYDGGLLPTSSLNHGRDSGPRQACCANCAGPGMPVWGISEPYLNLWVHDTPVFYHTSLGQEIAFTTNYKQRDTRPKDDGVYPTTGWNHNWYSYVHFDIPIVASVDSADTNTSIVRISARGVRIPHNWRLSADYQYWEAILYAPDNSESYFTAGNTLDRQNQRTLISMCGAGGMGGFRVVHGDGSQDIYSQVMQVQEHTYGNVERFGCVFDKGGITNAMTGLWQPDLSWGRQPWQDHDDVAIYRPDALNIFVTPWINMTTIGPYIQQLGYSDTPDYSADPAGVVEYISYDALLTARVDPYGNAITLAYGADNRLSTITDYDGRTNSITYDTNGYVQQVTMPYGRTASFVYDKDGNLLSATDAQGMTSSMTYAALPGGSSRGLIALTTPYGTTRFSYLDDFTGRAALLPSYPVYDLAKETNQVVEVTNTVTLYCGENAVNHAIVVTHPDLSRELFIYYGTTNGSRVPANLAVSEAVRSAAGGVVDNGDAGGEASLLARNCFHWDRAQTPLLSFSLAEGLPQAGLTEQDFLLSTWRHYPLEIPENGSANVDIAAFPTFSREGSPDGVRPGKITWFTYPYVQQEDAWHLYDEPLDSKEVTEAPDGTPLVTSFAYDWTSGLLAGMSKPYSQADGSVGARNYTWSYASIPIAEPDGTSWSLPYLSYISTPFAAHYLLTAPETTTVGGYTVLSWPTIPVQDAEGYVSTFYFNERHQLTRADYANGLTTENLYGSDGFLQKSIALQAQSTNTYFFQNGELASHTTPLGLTVNYTRDLLGRLTSAGYPDGTTVSNVFDKLDVVASKDRLGHWSYATYDNMRQLRGLTDRNGGTTSFSYCDCGGLESVTNAQQFDTSYQRDYLGRVINLSSAAGNVAIERDILGQPFHVSSSWGLDLHLAHNYQGLLTGVTNPAGTALSTVYDEHDLPVNVTDARGVSETRYFDGLRRLTGRYTAAGWVEYNTYSEKGISQHSDASYTTSYGYDSAGRLASVTNPNQEVTQLGYDLPHRRLSLTDGRNHTKWWAYDIYGRQVAETNANNVLVRTNGYDANSRLTAEWTATKGLTHFDRDNNDNVLAVRYPHSTVSYTYDHLDRLSTMSDAVGNHTFTCTNFGAFDWALASEAGPWATISHGYSGPNLASTSIGSWVESITPDAALRPHTITSPAGTFTYTFNGAGRQLASLQMPGITTTFGYTAVGEQNLIQVGAGGQTVDYHGYDYNGNGWITGARRRASPNDPQSTINYTYGYDSIGQLTSVQALDPDSTLRLNENLACTYDGSDNLASRTASTLAQTFNCDALNQLTNITRSGTLTVSGSLTGAVATLGVNGTLAHIYSDATFATTAGLALSNANNLFVTAGSNAAGQLVLSTITSTRLPEAVSLGYDLNGNLLTDGQRVMEYDDANRLTAVTVSNSCRSEFTYDGLWRRRVAKEYCWQPGGWVKTNETHYVCDGYLPMQERDASGNVLVTYTRGLDLSGTFHGAGGIGGLLARTDGSGSVFYHADASGNITSLTDSSGNAVARYLYDPFGRLTGKWGALSDANAIQFSSMPVDHQSGLSMYPFRAYDPSLQRWLNPDPIGEAGGINLYGFVGNNPISYIDHLGLDWQRNMVVGSWTFAGTVLGGIGGFVGGGGGGAVAGLGVGSIVTAPAGAVAGAALVGTAGGVVGNQIGNYIANSLGLGGGGGNQGQGGGNSPSDDSGGGKGVKFPGKGQLSKAFKCTEEQFHREVKPDILRDMFKDFPEQLKTFGDNPDVGFDSSGNIWLKSRLNGATFNTGTPVEWYSY